MVCTLMLKYDYPEAIRPSSVTLGVFFAAESRIRAARFLIHDSGPWDIVFTDSRIWLTLTAT